MNRDPGALTRLKVLHANGRKRRPHEEQGTLLGVRSHALRPKERSAPPIRARQTIALSIFVGQLDRPAIARQ